MQSMEQHTNNLNDLAAQLAKRLQADPNHPAAHRMRADLARLTRARRLEEAAADEQKADGGRDRE